MCIRDVCISNERSFIVDKHQQTQKIRGAMAQARQTGVDVKTVVADGPQINFNTARLLGVKADISNIRSSFELNGRRIFWVADACHMQKLMRNCLVEYKV